jgi:hypothetical protein
LAVGELAVTDDPPQVVGLIVVEIIPLASGISSPVLTRVLAWGASAPGKKNSPSASSPSPP